MPAVHELGLVAQPAAEDAPGVLLQLAEVAVRPRPAEPQQHAGRPGTPKAPDPVETRTSRSTRSGRDAGELLGDGPAQAHAEHVGAVDAHRVEHAGGEPGESTDAVGPGGHLGRADAGRVEGDGAEPGQVAAVPSSHRGTWLHTPPMSSSGGPSPLHPHPGRQAVDDVGRVDGHRSITYRPGAASIGRVAWLPSFFGAGRSSPERAIAHSAQCGHQVPGCWAAPASQASGSVPVDRPGPEVRLGVAGRVDQVLDVPAAGEHEGGVAAEQLRWTGRRPATARGGRSRRRRRRCRVTAPRSTGVPSRVSPSGVARRLSIAIRSRSRCRAPDTRVVSLFQARMSYCGASRPIR